MFLNERFLKLYDKLLNYFVEVVFVAVLWNVFGYKTNIEVSEFFELRNCFQGCHFAALKAKFCHFSKSFAIKE